MHINDQPTGTFPAKICQDWAIYTVNFIPTYLPQCSPQEVFARHRSRHVKSAETNSMVQIFRIPFNNLINLGTWSVVL